jgi:GT2 family glycosyltransferase
MDRPLMTVGILSWNRRDTLARALESVRQQTIWPQLEVLVVDSNSTDGSPEFIGQAFPWVTVRRWPHNPGLAEGRNILARLAGAPLVFWMDDDCELAGPQVLEKMAAFMDAHPGIGVLYAHILEGEDDTRYVHLALAPDIDKQRYGNRTLVTASFASGGTCVRRDLFLACGGYDEEFFRMNVENDLSFRVYDRGACICYYPEVRIIHRPHPRGRDYRVITYYSIRNKLWGLWRNLPAHWALGLVLVELPLSLARALRHRAPGAWARAVFDALRGLPRRQHLRHPVSRPALQRWAACYHQAVVWQPELPAAPGIGWGRFFGQEVAGRYLKRWYKKEYAGDGNSCAGRGA